ncbi:MAG: hypothetical protein N2Z58_07805 [Fervidobacterium sp.]|nr:hypothetical protein [Fervidobacterium sp.]
MLNQSLKVFILLVFISGFFFNPAFSNNSSRSYLYVSFTTDNFVGVEFRAYFDNYSHLFANIGVNYVKGGVRFSSKSTSGLYISPVAYVDYKSGTYFGLFAGWSTTISNLNNLQFFVEGGATKIPQKPESIVILGIVLRF